jgi:hypothetical protein
MTRAECRFLENSVKSLPKEIIVGNVVIAINSDKPETCLHLGTIHLVQARCRVCPYNIECECAYLDRNSDKALKLRDWAIISGKDPVEMAYNASNVLRVKFSSSIPEWLTILMICPSQTNLTDFEKIINAMIKDIDIKTSFAFEFVENEGITILICFWRA